VTFARLRPADWVVFVAALALLFTTAPDWYSTKSGEEARKIQEQARSDAEQPAGQVQAEVEYDAGALAEGEERNAWQEDGLLDRIVLVCLLATAALGVAAAFRRAGGRESSGAGAFGVAGLAACIAALLVLYRILQEPGFDEITVVKAGAPLALGVLGVMAFACATALREPATAGPGAPQTYNRER
jgi:drug/metabolite transporter (DMT)-like permease